MQIDRLFGIVYILLSKKHITAKELAQRFEVSVRTVYRDIDVLSAAGIPLYTAAGKGGGISLMDDFVLNRLALSEEEQEQILLALQNFSAVGSPQTEATLEKLGGLFRRSEPVWLEVDYSRWGSTAEDTHLFALLRQAILNYLVVRLEYTNAEGIPSSREIEPLRLVYKGNAWYIRAFCRQRQALRTFKLIRIVDAQLTGEHFEPHTEKIPSIGEQEDTSKNASALFLRFSPCVAHRIWEEFGAQMVEKMPDGYLQVEVRMPQDEWLYGFLLSYGGEVEVVKPAGVRRELAARVKKMCERYTEGDIR